MDQSDPLNRYPWLNQRYTFGGEYTFSVYDEVAGCSYGCTGHYVQYLEVYPVSVTEEQFSEWLRDALEKHSLTDCFLLDKDGKEIGWRDVYIRDWTTRSEVFSEIKFFVLEESIRKTKVVVYEVV